MSERAFLTAAESPGLATEKGKHTPAPSPSLPVPSPTADPSNSPTPDPTTSPPPTTTPTPTPTSCSGVDVPSGGDIQAAINAHGSGTTFCLSGTYSASSLAPKANDVFVGGTLKGNGVAHAFSSSASGVILDGVEISGYSPAHYSGAVEIHGSGWIVRNCYIHHNAVGAGLHWSNTTGTQILNNRLLYNGEEGFAGGSDVGTVFSDNEVGWNNTSHQNWNDEAGGGKFYKSTDLTVSNNYSHNNDGPGLWCDTNCYHVVFDGNRLVNNIGPGIHYEISYDAVIRNNTLSGNGTYNNSSPWYGSAGILVATSQNVQVYGNSSSRDGNGIVLLEQSRGSGNRGTYMVQNVSVHDNDVRNSIKQLVGLFNELSDTSYWSSKGNSFAHNAYTAPSGSLAFSWNGSNLTWSGWRSAGQDSTGSYSAT
jgi:parallel beta-helix repeat protein